MKKSLHDYQNREGFFGGQGGIRTHEPLARLPDFECVALRPLFRFFVSEAVSFVVPKSRTVTGFFDSISQHRATQPTHILQDISLSKHRCLVSHTQARTLTSRIL